MTCALLIIDPQNDFCDPTGALYVPGAENDMERLGRFIATWRHRFSSIHVTMDSHHHWDISHPPFWVDAEGNHPEPFSQIGIEDLSSGRWRTAAPSWQEHAERYVATLHDSGRYQLTIWPPHCLLGSTGHAVYPWLFEELKQWESDVGRPVDFILKGTNVGTEHYSALRAEVPDPQDEGTSLNRALIERLTREDITRVFVAGEALSHCLASTLLDLVEEVDAEAFSRFVLLRDCTSSVPGFEKLGDVFLGKMLHRGLRICNTDDFEDSLFK